MSSARYRPPCAPPRLLWPLLISSLLFGWASDAYSIDRHDPGLDFVPIFPRHYESYDELEGLPDARLPFTLEVQRLIHAHQHPSAEVCAERPIVAHTHHFNGLGSVIHVLSAALADAINGNQTLVWWEFGDQWLGGAYGGHVCPDDSALAPHTGRSFRCSFLPLTNCSYDASRVQFINLNDADPHWDNRARLEVLGGHYPEPGDWPQAADGPWAERLRAEHGYSDSDILHWWRAQGALYATRMNPFFAALMRARREALAAFQLVPLPLPPGTISIHVRRSDKITEAALLPLSDYFSRAEEIVAEREGARRVVFLSTDGEEVVAEELEPYTRNWTVLVVPGNRTRGHGREVYSFALLAQNWLNLLIHLEADHFVGTNNSNWCRLIDELRRVLPARLPAARLPYVNVPNPGVGAYPDW